ncbi:cellulase family glycosylhydrolase [Pseudonocardia adelaidensis]|uniref:Glycoside hydrolase family 5 domain-containing protein n=1 Tax=Pseudonocardia adelaidensis TaxID=648754 RepID=A0ABP9NVZ1_9PSEU
MISRLALSGVLLLLIAACGPVERTGPGRAEPAPAPSRSQTTVSVQGSQILVNGTPSTLFGFRVASAAMRDDWTDELISQLDTWRDHGVNSFVVWLQGSSGGYSPVFTRDGEIDRGTSEITSIVGFGHDERHTANGSTSGTQVVERTRRIVAAADARGMVAIVGLFYRSAAEDDSTETLTAAARTAAAALAGYSNVIFDVYNEPDDSNSIESGHSLREYLRAVKDAAPGRPVGTGTVETDESADIADMDDVDVVMQDAGSNADEAIDAFDTLQDHTDKPIINVESFGGSGQGFLDDDTRSVPAPPGYSVDFPGWRRVFGAWRDEDYASATDGAIAGKDSYRRLIDHVARDPGKQIHLMVHAAGWFQGASRVGTADHLGAPGTPDRWNNTFQVGPGTADGTPGNPGIGWILERIGANRG